MILLNPEKRELTAEKLRTFEGYENLTDGEAEEVIQSITAFCMIVLSKNDIVESIKKQAA